jgi:hypothetical protein
MIMRRMCRWVLFDMRIVFAFDDVLVADLAADSARIGMLCGSHWQSTGRP